MKEYGFNLDKSLTRGLRRTYKEKKNSFGMLDLFNLEPTPYGLVPFSFCTQPWSSEKLASIGIELSWPFPQLIRLKSFTLLLGADYLFLVNEEDWSLVQLDTYDFYNSSQTKGIKAGGYWQAIDFWDTFLLMNGSCTLWYDRFVDKVLVEDTVKIQAGCDYKGRAVFGGFDQDAYWSSAWQLFWTNNPSSIVGGQPRALGKNWIKWTSIGGGDLDLIFDADVKQDQLLKIDAGDMPMSHRSLISTIKELNQKLLVYSFDAVSLVSHKSQPVSTLGVDDEEIAPGIRNIGAVAGNKKNHVFVAQDNSLWWIGKDFRPVKLGYREFFEDETDLIVSRNPINGNFHISSNNRTFVLTWDTDKDQPHGLAEVGQKITSCIAVNGTAWNLGSDIEASEESVEVRFTTDIFDLDRTGDKSIHWITVHGEEGALDTTGGTIYVRVHYRYSHWKSFDKTGWRKTNKKGACYFPVAGTDFKIELKADNFKFINISRLHITFQQDDANFTRGINVSQVNR